MKLLHILIGGALILSATLAYGGESSEKGGTADINIGVGELQETSVETRGAADGPKDLKKPAEEEAGLILPAVQGVRESADTKPKRKKKGGNVETTWKVEKGEK